MWNCSRIFLSCAFFCGLGICTAADEPRVSIRLSPPVVMHGTAFWLTCTVPRRADNRLLEYGVVDFQPGSQRDLPGDQAAVTWKTLVEHTPCDVGPAYCAVQTADGKWTRTVRQLNIAGCEQ
jgi:hypothetical protein